MRNVVLGGNIGKMNNIIGGLCLGSCSEIDIRFLRASAMFISLILVPSFTRPSPQL